MKLRKCINIKSVCFLINVITVIFDLKILTDVYAFNSLESWLQYGVIVGMFTAWVMICIIFLVTIPKYCNKLLHDYIRKIIEEP